MRRLRQCLVVGWVAMFAALSGCASTSSQSANGNTLEGGVKIPGAHATSAAQPAASTVHVTLSDTRGAAGPMTLTISPAAVPAGDVTFVVKNTGTIEHEAIVLATNLPYNKIPITDGGDPPAPVTTGANKVSEDTNIGETGDPNLKPGDTRTFTIKTMTTGHYVIVCNLADHYGAGMRAPLTVS